MNDSLIELIFLRPDDSPHLDVQQLLALGEAARLLTLLPGQEAFVGAAPQILEVGLVDPERHPFVVVATPGFNSQGDGTGEGAVVGLGVLHVNAATSVDWPEDESAVLLRGFLMGAKSQGQGFGRRATEAAVGAAMKLASRLNLPAEGVVLGVNERNVAGLKAYSNAGFLDHGQYLGGRSGPQRIMFKPFAR